MARKRKVPSRKRRGLKWLSILAVLLLVNGILNLYPLFPGQVLATEESRYGIWDAETVRAIWDGGQRLYLRRSASQFSFSAVGFHPLSGWSSSIPPLGIPLDSEHPWGAWVRTSDDEARIVLFGFLPEEEEPPVLSIRAGEDSSNLAGSTGETEIDQFTPQADIPGEGGSYCLTVLRYSIPQGGYVRLYIQEPGAWARLEYYCLSPG